MAKGRENLKPVRSAEEARQKGRKGGKASGEARRRRKSLKESMDLLLNLDVSNTKDFNRLSALGVPMEDIDNSMLLTVGLFQKAKTGDVAAYKEIRDLVGEGGDSADGDIARLIAGLRDG